MVRRVALPFILSLLLTGCGGISPPMSSATGIGDVGILLWVSHQVVNVGQPLQISFTASNRGREIADFQTQSKPVMDINIGGTKRSGEPTGFLRWSDGKPLTADLTHLQLKPGESKTIEMTWIPDERFKDGIMSINGFLRFGENASDYGTAGVVVTVGFVPIGIP